MNRKKGNELRTAAPVVSLLHNPQDRTMFPWIIPVAPQQQQQPQSPHQPRTSILQDFPDLVDKALQPYPEALDAVARAVKEWYQREDAASRF